MPVTHEDTIQLLAITNEMIRRLAEFQAKEAQYRQLAEQTVPSVADRLYSIGLISEERKKELEDSVPKSASAPLQVLDELSLALQEAGANTLGTLYRPHESRYPTGNGRSRYIEVDDMVIDVSKYR